jgi:serine/threonine-protein kinase
VTILPKAGDLIGGKYRILRLIGEGGMGAVYEARHEHLGSTVALKFLHPELAQNPAIVARFLQEGRVSASIRSPHVTQVTDVDQTPDGAAYLVMELLDGETLEKRLERGSPLPLFDAVEIGMQILSALEVAHGRGIVHRDLKPDNVWLTPSPAGTVVKLLDFGIAKLRTSTEVLQISTRPGSIMGTPAYMAPEQAISADQVDHRADLYSFGVMMYEMLSGQRPIEADNPHQVIEALARGAIAPLSSRNPYVPANLSALVDMLVQANPDKRPRNATEVREELARFARVSTPPSNRPSGFESNTVMTLEPTAAFQMAPPGTGTRAMAQQPGPAWQNPQIGPPAWQERRSVPATPHWQDPNRPGAAWQGGVAPTAPQWNGGPPPHLGPPKRGKKALFWFLALFVAALAGGGVWLSQNPSVLDDSPLPPYPTALPTTLPTTAPTVTATSNGPTQISPDMPPVLQPVPVAPQPIPQPRAATPTVTPTGATPTAAPPLPSLQLPFPIPSGLFPLPSSLPTSFPSSLPDLLQQIPGLGVPAPTQTAPPTGSAPATP